MRILEFKSDIDGLNFMRKNCRGKILKYMKNGLMHENEETNIKSYKFNTENNKTKFYWYEYQGKEYQMTFYSEGDSYRVKIC